MHFKDATIHSGDGGSVPDSENHQAIITAAVTKLKGMTAADGSKITIETSLPTKYTK